MKTGIELIAEERQEQLTKHNRTLDYDAEHNTDYQLSEAATMLTDRQCHEFSGTAKLNVLPGGWNEAWWLRMCNKPYKERLIIAGALIAAEIDRLQRK